MAAADFHSSYVFFFVDAWYSYHDAILVEDLLVSYIFRISIDPSDFGSFPLRWLLLKMVRQKSLHATPDKKQKL